MSTDDRTPDIREVRSMYGAGSNLFRETPEQHYLGHPAPDYGAEFDRFLARVRREAKAEALREIAPHLNDIGDERFLLDAATEYETGDQA